MAHSTHTKSNRLLNLLLQSDLLRFQLSVFQKSPAVLFRDKIGLIQMLRAVPSRLQVYSHETAHADCS